MQDPVVPSQDALYWRTMPGNLGDAAVETPRPFDEWPLDFHRAQGRTVRSARGSRSFRVRLDAGIRRSS